MLRTNFLACLALCSGVCAQSIDDIRDDLQEAIRDSKFAKSVVGLIALSDELELSSARLTVDDDAGTEFSTLVLPFQKSLNAFGAQSTGLYLEGVVGYGRANQFAEDLYNGGFPAIATTVDIEWTTYGALFGAGPEFKLAKGLKLALVADVGLTRIENRARFSGPGADVTERITNGLAFNWDAMTWLAGGAVRLEWNRPFAERYETSIIARYDLRWISVFAADDVAQEFTSRTQIATLRGDIVGPTGWTVGGGEVFWRATAGYRRFLEGDVYGAQDFFEIGGALELDVSSSLPIGSRVSINAAIFVGEDIRGWSAGVGFQF